MLEMHRILKRTGTLYLHCDPTASHYLKVMADEIFGRERFLSEVIWKRTGAHSSARRPAPLHDVILVYSKSDTYTWNVIYAERDPEYVRTHYSLVDADGRRYQAVTLHATGTRQGSSGQPWRGIDIAAKGGHWKYTIEGLERLDAEGRIYWPPKGEMPRLKQYLDDGKGTPLQDVWTDIAPVNSMAKERLGYPTQKPAALLERILSISSEKGDVVLDPFCGCGTTLVAAQKLGRAWVGIDISPTAVNIMKERLGRVGATEVKLVGMPVNEAQLRALKPFEFQNWVMVRMHGTGSTRQSGDMGIDGYSFMLHEPIQVKQSDGIGRNVVDNFETAVERGGKAKGYIVAFSFGRGAHEEAARVKAAKGLEIVLVKVADLLTDAPDIVTPQPGLFANDLPLPEPRPREARPSVEELIASEHNGYELARAAEEPADYSP